MKFPIPASLQRDPGASPADEQLRVAALVVFIESLPGFLWSAMYAALGLWAAAAIPVGYSIVTLANLALCYRFGWRKAILPVHFTMMIILPFALQLSLGGIVASGFVAAWCAMAPVTALVVSPPRRSIGWFIACALSMTLAVALDPYVHTGPSQLTALSLFFFWMNTLGLASLVFGTLYYCNSQSRLAHLESERLLLNILPEVIARRLKSRQGVIADRFDDVCVIFADIVNFTALSAERTPEEIVTMLDKVFAAFDELADRHGLEKIKTIGDAYMVASGIPVPRNDSIEAAVEMALAMQEVVRNVNAAGETPIDLRIGMHAGKVVAGVIGRRKFSYDLWGDTVNTASRMESHGIPGTIQITQALAERIADRYACEPVGTIDVKGKGPMSVYRLMARKQR